MKICSIRLENVRQFTDAVEIAGIGPGLNVLAAPNEQGKSTIFDALHAVFFKDAKSWDKEIRALAPRVGGEPRVEVELDRGGLRYRIAKQFHKASGKGEIRIWRAESLFLQSDAAEAWVQELIKSPKEGGPAGLLWVRQGLTDFSDAKETLSARQDLLSSITGEVDAVTGGQRMDAVRRDIRLTLDRLVTSRGAKKGGALDLAASEVAQLQEQEQTLTARVQELRSQLDQRQGLRVELAGLQDAETQNDLDTRVQVTEQALSAANQYQEKLNTGRAALNAAQLLKESHLGSVAGFLSRQQEHQAASAACRETREQLEGVNAKLAPGEQNLRETLETSVQAQTRVTTAEGILASVQQQDLEVQALGRRKALTETLLQARKAQQLVATLTKRSEQGPDRRAMDLIEAARDKLALAEQAQQLAAPAVTVSYEPDQNGRLRLNGLPLAAQTRLSLPEGGRIDVPGIGAITVHPGQLSTFDQLAEAQAGLARALATVDCEDLAEARAENRERAEAAIRLQDAQVQLAALAPQGVLFLMQQVDALPDPAAGQGADTDKLPARATAEAELNRSRNVRDQASAKLEAVRLQTAVLRQKSEGANVRHQAAQQRLERAEAALYGAGDSAEVLRQLEQRAAELQLGLEEAQRQIEALEHAAPDLEAVQARAARAKSAQSVARERLQELVRALAVLDTKVSATAGDAVEEQLAEVSGQLLTARDRLAAVEFELAMLRRLDLALDQARSAAQEAYVAPVLQELQPLLRLLWPQAQLEMDADKILPHHLARDGDEEEFDSLSGGTQEQIALLVRLAFARLLARGGAAAPVILDDAIVYTDDARIERLFDALTVQASDLQILVFTCRQKSFRALGGTQLTIRSAATS